MLQRKLRTLVPSLALATTLCFATFAYADGPRENKYLANKIYSLTHFDPAQTDSFPYAMERGVFNIDLRKYQEVTGGPVNIMTMNSTDKDFMWGVSSQGVTYIDVKDGKFEALARYDVPSMRKIDDVIHRKVLSQNFKTVAEVEKAVKEIYKLDYLRIYNGIYSVVDKDNIAYANYGDNIIYAFGLVDKNDPMKGIKVVNKFTPKYLAKGERVAGLTMTYDGNLVIIGNSSVGVIDRGFKNEPKFVKFEKGEYVTNGAAVDEKNGIYVASDKYMRKVVWTGTELSMDEKDGAWQSLYEIGQQPPSVKVGKGTGSTPTLMGFGKHDDRLVVITDGANRMNLVAFWRDEIPADFKQKVGTKSRRIADQAAVTCGLPSSTKWIQTEQSVVVDGYGAFVVNNIVDKAPEDRLVGVIALGPVIAPPTGVEKFEWSPKTRKFESKWTRKNVSSISMVPAVSTKSGIVMVNGYHKETGWEVTGMDWKNGETVHRTVFGHDNFGNGAYALIQLFPNGDLLFNSIAGPVRIKYAK